MLVIALGATWATHRTLLGRDPGVTLIVVLLALKTLEMRARRDAFVVFFLGFFAMLTNFFFSQSLLTAAGMVVGLMGLLTTLVNAHMPVGRPPLSRPLRIAAWMALLGTPIMAALFLLFPRLAPLWGIPSDGLTGRSGLSAQMQVGNIAELALDSSIAMRVRFEGPRPPQSDLYFRGPVLSHFDGRAWTPGRASFGARAASGAGLAVFGAGLGYEVTLEPHNRPWLLTLDATAEPPAVPGGRPVMNMQLQWIINRPITDLLRYTARAHPDFRHGVAASRLELQDDLDLPSGFNPRTMQFAADLRRDPRYAQADAATLVELALQQLRNGGYRYTLEPGVTGPHSADEFWFDTKAGFCEHIASAFVVLMRALDVPARVVTGYQGGEPNAVDGYWTVRQSDAHAWTEVWIAGRGWVRVDPTTAVAPGRTGSIQRLRPTPGALAEAVAAIDPTLLQRLRQVWEATNNRWNQWVLNYTQSRQLDLLRGLGFESPDWQDLLRLMAGMLVAGTLVGALWALWERRQHDPWLRLLSQARRRLARAGLVVPGAATPRELAQRLALPGGEDAAREALRAWLLDLEAWRYAPADPQRQRERLRQLQQRARQLDWPRGPLTAPATPQ